MAEVSVAIADDNRQTLNLLGEILEKEDGIHVVGKADNGEDAYNMIVETNPDIVLMDVIMPRLDGISVMERVRNNSQMKGTPSFIMVTAASSQDVTEDAFRLGANYYIMKSRSAGMWFWIRYAGSAGEGYGLLLPATTEACGGYSHIWIRRRTWSRTWRPM